MFNAYIEQEPFFLKKQNPKTQNQKESTSFWAWLWAFNHGDLWYSDICTRMALVKKKINNLSLLEMFSSLNTLSILNSVFDRSLWSGSITNLVMPYFCGFWHSYLHLLFSPCWRQQHLHPSQCWWVSWSGSLVDMYPGQRDKLMNGVRVTLSFILWVLKGPGCPSENQ